MNNQVNRNFFTDGYLMLISVIQGATFGALIIICDRLTASELWKFSPYLLCSFMMLVGVLHSHLAAARDLHWPLDGFDVLIPVLLGLFQCAAILALASKHPQPAFLWFIWYSLVLVTLIGTVINGWVKSAKHDRWNHKRLKRFFLTGLVGIVVSFTLALTPVIGYACGWWKPGFVCTIIWILIGIRIIVFMAFCRRDWKIHRENHNG